MVGMAWHAPIGSTSARRERPAKATFMPLKSDVSRQMLAELQKFLRRPASINRAPKYTRENGFLRPRIDEIFFKKNV